MIAFHKTIMGMGTHSYLLPALARGNRVILVQPRALHAQSLRIFSRGDIPAFHLASSMSPLKREEVLASFSAASHGVLVISPMLATGWRTQVDLIFFDSLQSLPYSYLTQLLARQVGSPSIHFIDCDLSRIKGLSEFLGITK